MWYRVILSCNPVLLWRFLNIVCTRIERKNWGRVESVHATLVSVDTSPRSAGDIMVSRLLYEVVSTCPEKVKG